MKKLVKIASLVFVSAFAVVNLGTLSSAAGDDLQRGQATIKVNKVKGKIKIDGKAKEKSWKKAKNYGKKVNGYIETSSAKTNIKKTKSMATVKTWKILWDKTGIYCYMEVNDKTRSMNPSVTTDADSIEYHIDTNNLDRAQYGTDSNDAQYRLARDGKTITGWGAYDRNAFKPTAKGSENKSSYKQEVMIRWDRHGGKNIKKNKKVGFDIQVNDAVNDKRTTQIVWNAWDQAWTNPKTMGTLQLK